MIVRKEVFFINLYFVLEAQAVKRPYSALNQSKSRLQENASPKRAKTLVSKNNVDRSKAEFISYSRSDHHNSHRDSPRNCDILSK